MGKEHTTWAVVREETAANPAYRLWLDQTDCGLFMSEQDADSHARLIRSLEEQMACRAESRLLGIRLPSERTWEDAR